MYTSNFAKNGNKIKSVSIARGAPKWYRGKTILKLAPSWDIVMKHKNGLITDAEYTTRYYNEVLNNIDPQKVYDYLKGHILLCWEKSGDFCHRRIVAEWIENKLGIEVREI